MLSLPRSRGRTDTMQRQYAEDTEAYKEKMQQKYPESPELASGRCLPIGILLTNPTEENDFSRQTKILQLCTCKKFGDVADSRNVPGDISAASGR